MDFYRIGKIIITLAMYFFFFFVLEKFIPWTMDFFRTEKSIGASNRTKN